MPSILPITRHGRWQLRFDTCPPLAWLALQASALWPHWHWAATRVADGSDDPLGLAALATLGLLVARLAPRLRAGPSPFWLALAMVASAGATVSAFLAPPLAGALLAALAMSAGLRSFLPSGLPALPLAGLAVLALPVVSSLQFYAGYPLRVVTAQMSTWALQLAGLAAERSGSAMQVQGRLIIVDAPCSGVQMAWMAYFCACAVAAFGSLPDRRFLRRLPWVGLVVMGGNVLRNGVLVTLEATRPAVSDTTHELVGLAALALVCTGVVAIMRGGLDDTR